MLKDASYHQAAIQYNDEIADFAEALSTKLDHEEVARWSRAVAKQHRFHAGRHKKALEKLRATGATTVETEDGGEDKILDEDRIVHKSAADGKFVSEEFADKHPKTTYETEVPVHHDASAAE